MMLEAQDRVAHLGRDPFDHAPHHRREVLPLGAAERVGRRDLEGRSEGGFETADLTVPLLHDCATTNA